MRLGRVCGWRYHTCSCSGVPSHGTVESPAGQSNDLMCNQAAPSHIVCQQVKAWMHKVQIQSAHLVAWLWAPPEWPRTSSGTASRCGHICGCWVLP